MQRNVRRLLGLACTAVALGGCGGSDTPEPEDTGAVSQPDEAPPGEENVSGGGFELTGHATLQGEDVALLPAPETPPPPRAVDRKTVQERYADNSPRVAREVIQYSDNSQVNDGQYVEFHPNGQKFKQGTYRNDKPHGEWKYWHDNGQLSKTVTFNNGVPNGQWEVFREDGTKLYRREFRDGKASGEWLFFDESGEKTLRKETYTDGVLDGLRVVWYPSGEKKIEETFRQGKREGERHAWFENGQLAELAHFRDGQRHGKIVNWDKNGNKLRERSYENGEIASNSPSQ